MPHTPRKRFGQNFLQDATIINTIAAAIHPLAGQHMVEIGPGQGALTQALLKRIDTLTVVELDRDLVAALRAGPLAAQLNVIQGDALKVDFTQLSPQPLRLVGNLPYNISTPLIFHLLDAAACVQDMHFMLQKEVVARMGAAPGQKDYGRLSVMTQYRCDVEALLDVPPEAFFPAPKVQSAVVRLTPHPPRVDTGPNTLARVVSAAFAQRRKTLRNTLSSLLSATQIEAAGINPTRRAETLTLAEFAALANLLAHEGAQ